MVNNLEISGNNSLTNLTDLHNLTTVLGKLKVRGFPSMTDLKSLENLRFVINLEIDGWDLESLDGLGNLTSINTLSIGGTRSLSGLENLTFVNDLILSDTYYLVNMSGLENLASIGRNLEIINNWGLTSLSGLENLVSIGGELEIFLNDELIRLTGLQKLTFIGGNLFIYNNRSLEQLDLKNLCFVGKNISTFANSLCDSELTHLINQITACPGGGLDGNDHTRWDRDCTE
ncbi:MAG: hypothetical protein GY699_02110 [Desulfobacteraceae bacterium]|nr:hypothetical protein [Desulfobacteraceae bacterium]